MSNVDVRTALAFECGHDEGRSTERATVVKWLRKLAAERPTSIASTNRILQDAATAIEAGDHLGEG